LRPEAVRLLVELGADGKENNYRCQKHNIIVRGTYLEPVRTQLRDPTRGPAIAQFAVTNRILSTSLPMA
jgi:hypothetical protein